ncbi:MAG: succinate dehydrogenase/fumarate reductase iron-sulfur subunit [Oscillatoria sp. SIO1A7]|nr:succinate dehydrogenase/fumarate reductase iron-sulfur subunit [Oscillatoria sp. SIO1A7]
MKFTLKIWRQRSPQEKGSFETYNVDNISRDISFLEMLDILNSSLEAEDKLPIVFESDCREGICGSCGLYIDGYPHGPGKGITTCQLHMRQFNDGDTIVVEPWRAKAFPIVRDLMVDRSQFDTIIQAGGYITVKTGSAPDANAMPIAKEVANDAFDAAACIGCGACVATCKNGSAMLFVSAKASHLNMLPQGQPERFERARNLVAAHDAAGFGSCTNEGECQVACPKEIKMTNISRLNRDFLLDKIRNFLG